MKYKNLTIIGTSHIAQQSVNQVKQTIGADKPDIVAVELDRRRFQALISGKQRKPKLSDIKKIGVKGFMFTLFGSWAQKKLGKYVGVAPGSEMKAAIDSARQEKAKIALIDQNIEVTLRKFSKSLTWREKFNFLADIFKALILRKPEIKFDLRTVPSKKLIDKIISKVKDRYPSVYKVLIKERDELMAHKLFNLMWHHKDKKIVAVIGAGHEDRILKLIKDAYKSIE